MDNSSKLSSFFAKKKKGKVTRIALQQSIVADPTTTDENSAADTATAATAVTGSEALKNVEQNQEGWIELDDEKKKLIQTAGKTLTNLEYVLVLISTNY